MSDETERHSNFVLIVIVASAAVTQFVPQVRDYLVTNWMIVGLGGAAFLSLLLLADWTELERDRLARVHWIMLIVYLVHQFEEHGVDLLGRSYFFITYAQNLIGDVYPRSGFVWTPLALYRTNTISVWLPFLIAVWGGRRFIWSGLASGGLLLTNGIFHAGVALLRAEYNPGLGTAVVLFLPAGLLYFRFLLRHHVIGWPGVAGGVMFGAASHVAIVLGVSFDLRAGPPAPVFWVLGLAPLIANFLYEWLRRAWPISLHRQKT